MLTIEEREPGVVSLAGRLDSAQVGKAEEFLGSMEGPVVLDLSELEYIASSGIGVILKTFTRLHRAGQSMRLRNLQPHVRNIFHYAGLDQLLPLD